MLSHDHESTRWTRNIGEVLPTADLPAISDGEFEMKYLKEYPHKPQLATCCEQALAELAEEKYEGRSSCARVMARAMVLLREQYDLNVPRGWVPILRKLRAK